MDASASPRVATVVVQPTPFCNIDCRYCYLPDRSNKKVLALSIIERLFSDLFTTGWLNPHLTIIWHAGEPLVLAPKYYADAFAAIEALRPRDVQLRHAFQTNGTLINEAWCAFFKEWDIGVGVSIDGPRDFHDRNRVTRGGKGTFDKTLAGIRLLKQHQVAFHTISVLTDASIREPRRMLDFYRAEGIVDICFNVEESEGAHDSTLMHDGGAPLAFRHFLETFWVDARQTNDVHFIREIDGILPRIFRPEGAPMINEQVEPFGMLNMDCEGNVSSFSPELLGLHNADYGDYIVGNILRDSLASMLSSDAMRRMAADIAEGVARCERECGYFSVCGGGSPINKLTENGSFATTRTTFCELVHQVPADLVLHAFDALEGALERGDVPLPPKADPWRSHTAAHNPHDVPPGPVGSAVKRASTPASRLTRIPIRSIS